MAGLLDIFGTGGTESLGLLGMSPEDIKRSRDDAQAQALFALSSRLFQGGNTGQSIAQGLQMGQQAYQQAMKGQMADKLQTAQLQDMIRQRQEQQAAKAEQQRIQSIIGQGIRPATMGMPAQQLLGEDMFGQQVGEGVIPAVAAQPARFDINAIAPQLMGSEQGLNRLAQLAKVQDMLQPSPETLVVGDTVLNKRTMQPMYTAPAKAETLPMSLREFEAASQNPAYARFLEKQAVAKAPKFAVDLKDPTAVAKAQADIVKDWRGVVKDTGAMEVADRFKAAVEAVKQGNAGNKAADGALIYAIGKIYDPSGAVQEGDKATILGNKSIPDSIKSYAQKAFTGQDLLPSERNGLLSVASKIVESKAQNLEAQKSPYTNISKQLGGSGELLLNPLADILSKPAPTNDLAAAAAAELKRRRGQ